MNDGVDDGADNGAENSAENSANNGADNGEAALRARLLAALHHELRAPLARIAVQVAVATGADAATAAAALRAIDVQARRQLAWLADLRDAARFACSPAEPAMAPAYLHGLMAQVAQVAQDAAAALPTLAWVDAAWLERVLRNMAECSAAPVVLEVAPAGADVELRFRAGDDGGREWRAVATVLDDRAPAPGLVVSAQLVRAMGGCLQSQGASLRFSITVRLAEEADALAPAPLFELPAPFGAGHALLLLEPHEAMRDYLTEVAESAGFDVLHQAPRPDDGVVPALVLCADEQVWRVVDRAAAPPVLLYAARAPARPDDFAGVLYKPAPPPLVLDGLRRLLEISR